MALGVLAIIQLSNTMFSIWLSALSKLVNVIADIGKWPGPSVHNHLKHMVTECLTLMVTLCSVWWYLRIHSSPQKAQQHGVSEMLVLSLGCRGNPGSKRRSAPLHKPHGKLSKTSTDYGYSVHPFLSNEKGISVGKHTVLISLQLRITGYSLWLALCTSITYRNNTKQKLHSPLLLEEHK